jgi:type VI protein secretion system component VasF
MSDSDAEELRAVLKEIHTFLMPIVATAATDELAALFAKNGGHDATLIAAALDLDETVVTLRNLCGHAQTDTDVTEAFMVAHEMSDKLKTRMEEYRVHEAVYLNRMK